MLMKFLVNTKYHYKTYPQNQKIIQIPNPVIFFLITLFIPITYESIPTFYEFLPRKISLVCFYFNIIDVVTKKNLKIRVDYKTFMN